MSNDSSMKAKVVTYVPSTNSESLRIQDTNDQQTSLFLYFTACVVSTLSNMTFGIMIIWISPVAPKLLSDDPEINPLSQPITTVQLSIIASIPAVGFVIGPLLLKGLFDKFGRKTMLMITGLAVIASLTAIAFASDIRVMCVEIIINFICICTALSGATIYLSEISDVHDRAKISCIGTCGIPLGNLMCYVFSSMTSSVRGFTLLSAAPAAVCLVIMFLVLPETPVYLASKQRHGEALLALKKLRNKTEEGLQHELSYISYVLEETRTDTASVKALFSDKANRRALIVAVGVHIIHFFCGSPTIMTYLTIIFDRAGTKISSDFASILLTSIQLVFFCGATQVVGRFGRRTLLIFSTTICTVMLFSLGGFFCLKSYRIGFIDLVTWWPLVALIIFYSCIAVGVGPLSWILASEMFPSNVIAAALSIIILCDGVCAFVSVFIFPLAMEAFDMHWVFWGFSVAYFLGFLFVYFEVPESRGKNLLEIRKMLIDS